MHSESVIPQQATRLAVFLVLVCVGCTTTSNDVGTLPMLYRPLQGLSPCQIAQYTPSDSLDTISERLRDHPDDSRLLADHGWLLAKSGQHSRAVEEFRTALAAETDHDPQQRAELLCRMGITYYAMGKLPEAIKAYSAAIEHDKDSWELYFHRWLALQYAGRTAEAAADRAMGQSLKPDVFQMNYSSVGGII